MLCWFWLNRVPVFKNVNTKQEQQQNDDDDEEKRNGKKWEREKMNK